MTTKRSLKYRKTTIHGSKGETHDVTILISSAHDGGESHWKRWTKDPDSEAARFAYVASSSPKELLIWAEKALKPEEREQLEAIVVDNYEILSSQAFYNQLKYFY